MPLPANHTALYWRLAIHTRRGDDPITAPTPALWAGQAALWERRGVGAGSQSRFGFKKVDPLRRGPWRADMHSSNANPYRPVGRLGLKKVDPLRRPPSALRPPPPYAAKMLPALPPP